ncbi:MAG: pyridoxamine 5'-phosphate oxidase family protein [Candidatus Limnocylindrales bacterium]|jgi:nitroimidazol reductase NimA-like FMN-containing flavoprotein (pyridoxamine 5'-phosphate oxidase superfamily)
MDDTTARPDAAQATQGRPLDPGPIGARPAGPPAPRTDRTRIRRHADRAVPDRIEEFLRTGTIAHVALVEDGEPRLIPFLYHYEAGHLYLHGSPGNATLRLIRDGRSVAVAVTQLVDLIASKTAADHSANYRSVVAYGRGRQIADLAEKRRVLDAMTARYFPGRSTPADYAPATDDDLVKMELTDIEIDEASAKMREGGPMGPHDSDSEFPGSAYVLPV